MGILALLDAPCRQDPSGQGKPAFSREPVLKEALRKQCKRNISPYHLSRICPVICPPHYITNYLSNEERTRKQIDGTNGTDRTDKIEKQFSKNQKKTFFKIAYLICPIRPDLSRSQELTQTRFQAQVDTQKFAYMPPNSIQYIGS